MRNNVRCCVLAISLLAMLFSLVIFAPEAVKAQEGDTTPPLVDMTTASISTTSLSMDEYNQGARVHFSVKITDESEIEHAYVYYSVNGHVNGGGTALTYNPQNGLYEGDILLNYSYYGLFEVNSIRVADIYGNVTDNRYSQGELPSLTFHITGSAEDHDAPIIDYAGIEIERTVSMGSTTTVRVPISDASGIAEAQVEYIPVNGGDDQWKTVCAFLTEDPNEPGMYTGELNWTVQGTYMIRLISAIDQWGNQTRVLNSSNTITNKEEHRYLCDLFIENDLSFLNVLYGSEARTGTFSIDWDSFSVQKTVVGLNEENYLYFRIDSDYELYSIALRGAHERYDLHHILTAVNVGGNLYRTWLPSDYYGEWRVVGIDLVDIYGNTMSYVDRDHLYWEETVIPHHSMDNTVYHVGLIDPKTQIAVSDGDMNESTSLEVIELDVSAENREDLVEEDYESLGFYEVDVKGERAEETNVFFPVEGLEDGTEVIVVHIRDDGTVEEIRQTVHNGMIRILTDSFSPFLVKTRKDNISSHQNQNTTPSVNGPLAYVNQQAPYSWVQYGGNWYYKASTSAVVSSWRQIDGRWYYFGSDGIMKTKWFQQNGNWYYLNNDRQTGWQKIDGSWYYMNGQGVMQTGWKQISGVWYYLGTNGAMKTYWQQVDGSWYYLGSDGHMQTGWQKIGGSWYYLKSDGTMASGWQKVGDEWYYLNNTMVTGWKLISGKWYYFGSSGAMATGWKQISGKWYYMGNDGAMRSGWSKVGGSWYYLGSDGAMRQNWAKVDGGWYYFGSDGAMRSGWAKIDGGWYYFGSDGAMRSGWAKVDGIWYYLDPDNSSKMIAGTSKVIDGVKYTFSANGALQ